MPEPYYDDGTVTIYHGEALDVLRIMPTASVDVVLTDPPYSSGGMFSSARAGDPAAKYSASWVQNPLDYGTFGGDSRDQRTFHAWVAAWSFQALRVAKPGAHAFVFSDWRQLPTTTDALQLGGWTWRGVNVWDKKTARPAKGRFYNTIEFVAWATHGAFESTGATPLCVMTVPAPRGDNRHHVTQKPVGVLNHLLAVVATPAPLVVLDPFMGSGSSLVAAKYAGHRAIGIEVEERYCEAAASRLAQGGLFEDAA